MSDEILNAMIIRHAVLEQLVLDMLAAMSREYEDPNGFRQALFEDIRGRFSSGAQNAIKPGEKSFAERSLQYAQELETRARRIASDIAEH